MNKLKKSLALVAMLAIASTAFAACGDSSSVADSKPADSSSVADASSTESSDTAASSLSDDGDKLTILCWTDDDLKVMMKEFGNDKVVYQNVGKDGAGAKEQYTQYFAGGDDADLFVLEADWILDYIDNDDYCADIAELGFTDDDFKGCYDYTVSIGTNSKNKLKAVSWQATPGAYVYRTDLAEKILGVKTREEMQAKCADWATFEETAEIAAKEGVAMADTLGGMWQVYQYNKETPWAVDNKLVVEDYCSDYAELAKKWYDNGYVTKEAQWDNGWYAISEQNKTMGYFFCTWCLGAGSMLSNAEGGVEEDGTPKNADLYGKYNICAGPSSYAWGGSWLAVSPKCDNKTLAHDFVKFFTVDETTMEQYALAKSEFVNNPTVMKKIVDDKSNKNPLLGGEDQFAVLLDAASKIDMDGKITRFDSQIKNNFNDAVNKYVKGDIKTVEDMITEFKTQSAEIEGLTVE